MKQLLKKLPGASSAYQHSRVLLNIVYEGWLRGRPAGEHEMDWTMEYRVIDGGEQVAVSTVRSRWRCISVDELESEIERFGLSLTRHDGCVVVCRPL